MCQRENDLVSTIKNLCIDNFLWKKKISGLYLRKFVCNGTMTFSREGSRCARTDSRFPRLSVRGLTGFNERNDRVQENFVWGHFLCRYSGADRMGGNGSGAGRPAGASAVASLERTGNCRSWNRHYAAGNVVADPAGRRSADERVSAAASGVKRDLFDFAASDLLRCGHLLRRNGVMGAKPIRILSFYPAGRSRDTDNSLGL